ncbi:MAG: hypothetical protein IH620_02535, partial [Ignavibacterium sp.]|nr:hypothetical protein [Ignavibacterium sp.]
INTHLGEDAYNYWKKLLLLRVVIQTIIVIFFAFPLLSFITILVENPLHLSGEPQEYYKQVFNYIPSLIVSLLYFIAYIWTIIDIKYFILLNENVNLLIQTRFSDSESKCIYDLNIEMYSTLREINKLNSKGENSITNVLIFLGYKIFKRNNESSIDFTNNNFLLNNIAILINSGYLILLGNDIKLTIQAKEKIELPSTLYIFQVPPKFDYEFSRAYQELKKNNIEESIRILSTNILESFTSWLLFKITEKEKLKALSEKFIRKEDKSLGNASLMELYKIFKATFEEIKEKYGKDEVEKIDYVLQGCINLLQAARMIRNDYSHQREISEFQQTVATEDAYNLLQLSRTYINLVCRYIIP